MVGKLYLEKFAKVLTEVKYSSEFHNNSSILNEKTMIIAISQSGENFDFLEYINRNNSKFMGIISFSNNMQSELSKKSLSSLNLFSGESLGYASTKAYTSQLFNLLIFSIYLGKLKWIISDKEVIEIIDEIKKIPYLIQDILKRSHEIKDIAKILCVKKDFILLGRSFEYTTALEGATKIKEISNIHASGYAGGEFKHGPIAIVSNNIPLICICPRNEVYIKMLSNIEEVRARNGIIISIHSKSDTNICSISNHSFHIPDSSEWINPILSIVPLQLFAYYLKYFNDE
jgi:glutamine---fructose-6-phosphate transaminase (isomerizing)